jgi:mono/diheme cytochrome c family protein
MKTTIIFCIPVLLLFAVGCKQPETTNTTSSETTATVATTTTAPVTETAGTTTESTSATGSAMSTAPVTTTTIGSAATEPAKAPGKKAPAKSGVTGPTVTETHGSTAATSTPPVKTAPPTSETKTPAAPAPTTTSAPAATSNASLIATGQSIFKGQCVACHGADASGNTAIGKKNNIPDFRSDTVQGRSDANLANVLTNGIGPISASAHKSKHLSSDQEKAVIAYIRSLK